MKIQKVELTAKVLKQLDYLDRMIFPTDEPFKKEGNHWWIVSDDQGPVGFAGVEVKGPATVFFCRAGIFQRYTGQGLHLRLIRARETWARSRTFTTAVTYTTAENLRSANNLIRCGFRLYKPTAPIAGALHFRKEL